MNSEFWKPRLIFLSILVFPFFSFAQTDTVLIDFGNINLSPVPWNNVTHPHVGQVQDLINSKGFSTGISIAVEEHFTSINNSGTQNPDPLTGFPSTATADSFFGNTEEFDNQINPQSSVVISNLNIDESYELIIFASREATDNRETQYHIQGTTLDSFLLEVSSNTNTAITHNLFPATDGTITITATPGPNNDNSFGFFYLGALKVVFTAPPPPPAELNLVFPNGGELWQVGKTPSIAWNSQGLANIIIDLSLDGGASWTVVDTVPAFERSFPWTVPDSPSDRCLIRLTGDAISTQSADFFEISNDTLNCPIVVLGSSTAAGAGASTPDSAWVNRYRYEIFQRNTKYELTNLARGGYTTFHILPDGSPISPTIPISIDSSRNVSQAMRLEPFAIIVNMPSNDAANNFSADRTLQNFATIAEAAAEQGAETWICTTQPRNFSNASQIHIQREVADSVFSIYGDHAIDFWSGLAATNGYIRSEYNSGDGVHLNDAGHRLLFQRVLEKGIHLINCSIPVGINPVQVFEHSNLKVYPNPFTESIFFEWEANQSEAIEILFYDLLGRQLDKIEQDIFPTGIQVIEWSPEPSLKSSSKTIVALLRWKKSDVIIGKEVRFLQLTSNR